MPREHLPCLAIVLPIHTTTNITVPLELMNCASYHASLFEGRIAGIDFSTLLLDI